MEFPEVDVTYRPKHTREAYLPAAGSLTQQLWDDAAEFFDNIMSTPFINNMANGTITPEEYAYYLKQDNAYLATYIKSLRALAAKSPNSDIAEFWEHSAQVSEAEVDSHNKELDAQQVADKEDDPSPACLAYRNFLADSTINQSYAVGCGAMLPCFWSYPEVAFRLQPATEAWEADHPGQEHPFAEWINMYSGKEFTTAAQQAIHVVEAALNSATLEENAAATAGFMAAILYEVLFFDQARLHALDQQ